MTTTSKTRRPLQVRQLPAEEPLTTPTPKAVQDQAFDHCDRAMELMYDAARIGQDGDTFDTITDAAHAYLERAYGTLHSDSAPLTYKAAEDTLMEVLTGNAILLGLRALKPAESQNILLGAAMDSIGELVACLDQPLGFWPEVPAVDHFQAGRDLALALMQDAHRIGESQDDTPEAWRHYRHGGAQNRFALPHLAKLVANPALLDGFSAMLSCWLYQCWAGWTDPEQLASIPAAEFEAGVPGEDGTKSDPEQVGGMPC